jgi:hypothetical protein
MLPAPYRLGQLIVLLPRELRDHVFFYIVSDASDSIAAEWIEAAFTHRVCRVTFQDSTSTSTAIGDQIWGACSEYKHFIRCLIVDAPEATLYSDEGLVGVEWECTRRESEVRAEWNQLLALTRLESLTVRLQKKVSHSLSWANFSPIVYQLRERNPKLCVEMYISFDDVLRPHWLDWQPFQRNSDRWTTTIPEPYLPMGYADVSELFQPPTAEDRVYVEKHLSGVREIRYRDIVRGLLDETPTSRRQLAQHYLVKEPSLLRVLMAEHYELYKRTRREREPS